MSVNNAEAARLWMAMDIGPYWIGRDDDDPLSPAAIAEDEPRSRTSKASESPVAAESSQARQTPEATLHRSYAKPVTSTVKPVSMQSQPSAADAAAKVVSGAAAREPDSETLAQIRAADWKTLGSIVASCKLCPALVQNRLSTVFGTAEPTARMVIVGEAPGRDEDLQGKPFVGKSGELLENILKACGLRRGSDVAIINVLKCRPPNNRDPQDDEIRACGHFLHRQLEILNPSVIVLASRFAAHTLLKTEMSTGKLRGSVHQIVVNNRTVPAVVTYHPSYLLRSPAAKNDAWRDFCAAKNLLTASV